MEGHHRHETDIDGKVRHEEKEDPSHGGQDCTGTMPDTAGSDPQADTTPDTDTTRLVDQDLTDMVGSDFTMDISAADVDSEFLDLPRRLSGRSSPSMIYRLSQDGQELITGVDSCRITVPSSLPKTVHLPQTLVHHDLPDIEVSDVNIVDVDIVIDHTYDNTDVTTHAPTDCTHAGNVDRGNRRDAGLWINLEPQCHTLLSPRSSAGSISSYRSSNDSAIELLTPDDDMPGSDTQVWDSQAEGDYNKGAMWDNDTTVPNTYSVSTDSGNAITLWSELLYSDSSHQDSFNRVPFSLTADSKLRPDRDASREPTTASEYPEGPFTTGAFSTTSDCDLAGPTSFSNQQQGPHSPSIHKEGTISSIEHKQGPLQSHDYHGRSSWEPFSSRNYKKTSLSCHDFSVEPVVSSANPTFMCVAPPSVVISDFSTKVPLEDKGSQTSDSTQYTYLEQPYVKCHRSMSSSSISSNESSSTSFSVQSDSSVDVDDNLEIPLPTVKKKGEMRCKRQGSVKDTCDGSGLSMEEGGGVVVDGVFEGEPPPCECDDCVLNAVSPSKSKAKPENRKFSTRSSWKKIRNIVHWSPFIQQFKRRQYPWIQLAGHQGNFQAGEPGAILKKYDAIEHRCFNKLMKDVLRPYVPEYRGEVAQGGECYVQLQDLLCEFDAPCVMDVKMGRRTYLEDELVKARQKPSLRKDMYQKMVEVDPSAPTEAEHQQQGITKPRYMQWRDEMSSSIEHGFRIEGIRTSDGASIKDFKKTKHKDNIKETLKYFVGDSTTVLTKYLRRLKSVRATQEDSAFFRSHEVIGSSLLFVHDKTGQASVWMIDFGKTVPLADNLTVDHRSEWHEGNHEDGYMYGLDSLIQIFTELLAACSENVTSDSASRRENLITCSSETMMSDSTSRRENLITCNSETMMSDSSTSSRRENLVSATNSDTRVSGSSDKFVNIVSDSNVECDSKCEPNNKTTDTIGHYS